MKKIIAAVLGLAMMSSSVAFADSVSHSKLSAFQNVKTTAVSDTEMRQVSGSGVGPVGWLVGKLTVRGMQRTFCPKKGCAKA